ncbi:TerB family tellurite resistance protein [Flavobacteriaceae bacterium R38]|nr:TerB family tellurite resistance protein [Flavobacteriaceae bacterium R38]
MNTEREKLGILSQMIALAKADNKIEDSEYELLLIVAEKMGFNKSILDELFKQETIYVPLKPESERILQFHRLVLLMNIDEDNDAKEMEIIYKFGLKMGLNPGAISTVFKIMFDYPNRIVPPDVLINIFKAQHN